MLVSVLALAVALTAPAVASAQPKVQATEWLAKELKTTEREGSYCELYGEKSVGETIECMLAFKSAGEKFASDRAATYKWVLANQSKYVGSEPCETAKELSAGAVAKFAFAVEAQGGNPEEAEGKRNLIKDLECLQVKEGGETGRFSDKGPANYSNVFGQSLAIIALKACETTFCTSKPNLKSAIEAGATYLRSQQCTKPEELAGAFRSTMGLPTTKCNTKPPFNKKEEENPNAVEVDSTGMAVQALLTAETSGSKAAESALKWLHSYQTAGGAWESYCSEAEYTKLFKSANSTALGIMADVEGKASFGSAVKWLEEAVEGQPASERGLPACGKTGKPDVLASAQGVLGLYDATYPHLVGLP
jgi:hypothetical protein